MSDGNQVILSSSQTKVFDLLANRIGTNVDQVELFSFVWDDYDKDFNERYIRNLISSLRKKVPDATIKNVYGGLYILQNQCCKDKNLLKNGEFDENDEHEFSEYMYQAQKMANMGSWSYDIVNDKLEWSDHVYEIFEIDKAKYEPSYTLLFEKIHPEDRKKVDDAYKKSILEKTKYDMVHRIVLDDGRIKHLQEEGETVYDDNGNAIMSIGTVVDITKERSSSDKILNSQQNLTLVTDGKNIHRINQYALRFFGYESLGEFLKFHNCFCEFFIEEEGYLQKEQDGKNWLEVVLENQQKTYHVKMNDTDGNQHIFQINTIGEKMDEENSSGELYVVTFTDITELINSERKLLLSSRNAAMGEMIAMIAHQWRQPLASINLAFGNLKVQRALGTLSDETWKEKTKSIETTMQYMSRTIDDFKDFFKNDDKYSNVYLKEFVEKGYHLLEASFKSAGCGCEFTYHCDENLRLFTYANKFEQVMINLLKNSLDEYRTKNIKGISKVDVFEENEFVKITVCDNAGGIPDAIITKIFEPYFSTKAKNGTGIGLHMVKTIIEKHLKGTISTRNQEDGAMFEIIIPKEIN